MFLLYISQNKYIYIYIYIYVFVCVLDILSECSSLGKTVSPILIPLVNCRFFLIGLWMHGLSVVYFGMSMLVYQFGICLDSLVGGTLWDGCRFPDH